MKFSSFHVWLCLMGLLAGACSRSAELIEPGIEVFEIVGYEENNLPQFGIPKKFHLSNHVSFPQEGHLIHSAIEEQKTRFQFWGIAKIDAVTEEPTSWRLCFSTGYSGIRAEVKPTEEGYVGTHTLFSCTMRNSDEFPIQLRKVETLPAGSCEDCNGPDDAEAQYWQRMKEADEEWERLSQATDDEIIEEVE